MSRVFVLGDRTFSVPEQTTARQDAYMIAQAVEAGIMKFAEKKLDEATTLKLTATIFKSGKLEYLLAAGLVEDGVKWTAESANANAEFFGDLTDPDSKFQLLNGIVEVLAVFFRGALSSSMPSPSVSETTSAKRQRRKPATPSTQPVVPVQAVAGVQ